MKKIPFYFFVLFYVIGYDTAMCQHAVTQAAYPNDVERTIVREYNYPTTVSYVETSAEHYFAYADASMTVTNCEISHNLYVTDLVLHGDFAYFCGYNTVSGVGVWGWFDVNTLISGALSYYTYDNFGCSGLYADSLFSLEVYEQQGQLHVVTVGSTTDAMGQKKTACLIDITGTENIATGWNYQMGITLCTEQLFNRLTRVCVTDNFIVAAGAADLALCSEGYRIHRRSNPFMAGGPQDSLFVFPGVGVSPNHNGSDMALTYTSNDHFASAAYCFFNTSIPKYGILVNVYDIAQVLSVYAASPVYSKYTQLPAGSNYSIFDLIYNRTSNSLYLLTNGQITSLIGSFVSELPLPLPASFDFFYMQDVYLTSLDNYNGHHNILAQGNDGSNTHTSTYYTQPVSTAPLCISSNSFPTNPSTYSKKTFYCPYTVCSVSFDCIKFSQNKPMIIPNNNICLQP